MTGRAAGGAGGGSRVWARSCGRCQGKHVFASQRESRDPGRTPSCWYCRRVPSLRSFSYRLRGGPRGGPGWRWWKNGEASRGAPRPATGQHPAGAGHRWPLPCPGPAGSPRRWMGGRRLLGAPRRAPAPRSRVAKSAGRRFKAEPVCAPCLPVEKVASSPASVPCCGLGRGSVCVLCPGLSQQLAIPPRAVRWLSGSFPCSAAEAAVPLCLPPRSFPKSSLLAHAFRPGRCCF